MTGRLVVVCLLAAGCAQYEIVDMEKPPNPLDNQPDPCIEVSPPSIDFGMVHALTETATEVVTVHNSCEGDLEIYDLSLQDPGAPFLLGNVGSVLVPAQSSTDFTVTFAPYAASFSETQVLIDTNDPQTPTATVEVMGTGDAPAEEEEERLLLRPAQAGPYVLTVDSMAGRLTRIHGHTHAVDSLALGERPGMVQVSAEELVVVHDSGLDAVHLLDAETLDYETVEVWEDVDRMALSPDGRWALLWRAEDLEEEDQQGGVESYSVVSLVDLDTGEHWPAPIGFFPRKATFSEDSSRAVMISDGILAAFDLTEEAPWPSLIHLGESLEDAPPTGEALLSADGRRAVVRMEEQPNLAIIDLDSEVLEWMELEQTPTDLDLLPDGHALVVLRAIQQLHELDLDELRVLEVWDLPDVYGQILLTPFGRTGLLYTTAQPIATMGVWEPDEEQVLRMPLVKPVEEVSLDPTGKTVLVFHTYEDAPEADPDSPFRDSDALTLMHVDTLHTHPLKLSTPPMGYAHGELGRSGYLVLEGQQWLEALDYERLLYEEIPLRSPPVFLGTLPAMGSADPVAWITQSHQLGRISFWSPEEQVLETITGYELNSGIE